MQAILTKQAFQLYYQETISSHTMKHLHKDYYLFNFPTCNSSRYRNYMTCRQTKALLPKQDWNLIKRLNFRSHSLPLYFFGIAGNKEAQGPLLHFHVVSRVYQGAVRICRPKMSKQKVISQNLQGFALITASGTRCRDQFSQLIWQDSPCLFN